MIDGYDDIYVRVGRAVLRALRSVALLIMLGALAFLYSWIEGCASKPSPSPDPVQDGLRTYDLAGAMVSERIKFTWRSP